MKAEIKKEWLAALRSGEYSQTTGGLHDDIGYCCLGVLCDLHAKATDRQWEPSQGFLTYINRTDVLPLDVIDWADLPDDSPDILGTPISVYNDGHLAYSDKPHIKKHTFQEIADLIEVHL